MVRFNELARPARKALLSAALGVVVIQPGVAGAQERELALEEIVVTAQRRAESLQDVPISIEVFGGTDIRRQGFSNLDDLANFSTTVLIEPRTQDQDVAIRGFGTTGNALTLDAATPFFVDGIHFGRPSQVKLAFMDVESVEVLKGPQPVYFGQNATAGAFNIRSKRPTDTWEGYADAEFASNNANKLNFGIGGPLSDTWGIRVAGTHESSDGFMKYVVGGKDYGAYENNGGRVILQFEPNEQLTVTGKVEVGRIHKDNDATGACRTDGPLIFGRGGPLDDPGDPPGNERSVWDQETGSEWLEPFRPLDTKCFSSAWGISEGGPYYEPPQTIRQDDANRGSVDMRSAADAFVRTAGNNGVLGYEDLDTINGYLEFEYTLDNGIQVDWMNGFASYERDYSRDNTEAPFLMNFQGRGEDFEQFSSEIRLTSPTGGKVEWNAGLFYQNTDLGAFSSSLRGNVRQSQRFNVITEEVDFFAAFGTLTFNFMDDRMALDIGGRWQDVDKFATVEGYAASWIFTVCPGDLCTEADGLTPVSVQFDPGLDGYAGCEGENSRGDVYCLVDPSTARMLVDVAPGTLLYAMPYRETRNVPPEWWSGNAIAVGLTAPDYAIRADRGEGPWAEKFTESGFSPQVTLRWHATDDISVYARYAESTKIGGFDTGQTSIPEDVDELTFETEDAEQIEIGVKGTVMDGRLGFDADIFQLEFPNLQTTVLSPDPEQGSASANAGQRVRGVEFNLRFAATDNLRLGLSGALMDGEMTNFPGAGCTDKEIGAAVLDPNAECKLFDGDVRVSPENGYDFPLDPLTAFDDYLAIIDRTGKQAPRTPEWKFVASADYSLPFGNDYEFNVNLKGYVSDGYILDVESFSDIVDYDTHEDLNILVGIRNVAQGWSISAFARNLLEARPTYHPENDVYPDGLEFASLSPSSFTTYGIRFEYLIE